MKIYPAIDLKEGKCVRLFKGDMAQAKIYNESALDQAQKFEKMGVKNLHVVDLDGAIAGKPVNSEVVKQIIENTDLHVQLGGGIRDLQAIENWLNVGLNQVILGTIAVQNPEIVKEACAEFPGKIIVGIDAMGGNVATQGWVEDSGVRAVDLAKKFEDCGVSKIIYTDIARDGALTGVNIEETVNLARAVSIPVVASGGVASVKDIDNLKKREGDGIEGVIIGKAYYEGRVKLEEII